MSWRNVWVAPLATLAIVLAIGALFDRIVAEGAHRDERADVLQVLGTVRARLEGLINSNVLLIEGLVAEIAVHPEIGQRAFGRVARELMRRSEHMLNLAAARDLVITHMYPIDGNEAAIGLDYRENAEQRAAALRVRETGGIVVAGPLRLVQGGVGIIGRVPVFTAPEDDEEPNEFWGLVSTVIDVYSVYRDAGLLATDFPLEVAIRGRDALGARGETFFGRPELFDSDIVTLDIALPGGSWQIGGLPRHGWTATTPAMWIIRAFTAVAALLATILAFTRARQAAERARAQAELETSRARLVDAIESIHEGFALWDPDDRLILCNSRYREIYAPLADGLRAGDRYEALLEQFVRNGHVRTDDDPEAWREARLRGHREARGDAEVTLGNGLIVAISEQRTADGGLVGIHTDVTEIREAEEHVRHRAYFDPLTGLANRANFMEQLESAIARAKRARSSLALLFVDLDRFKNVNDTLGHDVGDALLAEAGRRIESSVRSTDTVARLGGDEFTVILNDVGEDMAPTVVAESVIAALERPFLLSGHEIFSGASVGITRCPDDGDDVNGLLRNADMAMYRAKEEGRATMRYFAREMTERAQRFVAMEKDIRHAIERDEFEAYYQPVVDLASRAVTGGETLLRWTPPGGDPVPPSSFIPVAEESGLIAPLGEWVLDAACRHAVGWTDGSLRVAVNVSSRQFRVGFDAALVERILAGSGLTGDRLILEITESLLMDESERIRKTLHDLRDIGVGIAVDDFGTGYSSLSYLRRFPVTALKVDRAFVRDMVSDPGDARLVEAVVAMARGLGITAVAEGVENEAQAALLRDIDCPLAQGYLFGRPMPAGTFAAGPGSGSGSGSGSG